MTIISDDYGNLFNAELVLKDDCDVRGHRLLARALLEQRNEMYEMLELAISFMDGDSVEDFAYHYSDIKTLLTKARGEP